LLLSAINCNYIAMFIENENIAVQKIGNQTDMIELIRLANEKDAEQLYNAAKLRLLNMWNWSNLAEGPSSEFELTDSNGNPVNRPAVCGDKFKIDLRSEALFGGYKGWVEIVYIQDEFDPFENIAVTSVKVVPTLDPKNEVTKAGNFYTNDASSTFVVRRIGQVVSAEIYGRNEVVANKGMQFLNALRHFVGTIAAKLGFPMSEWKRLAKGLLGISQKDFAKQCSVHGSTSHKAVA
jgi:hypothetical protein